MKKIFSLMLVATMALGIGNASAANDGFNLSINKGSVTINGKNITKSASDAINGSGNIITKSHQITEAYTSIHASRGVKVTMEAREGSTAMISADDNIMPYVVVKSENGVLTITINDKLKSLTRASVEVKLPRNSALKELRASSAAEVIITTPIENSLLALVASSAGEISFISAEVDILTVAVSSAANASGSVKAEECHIEASSAANARIQLLATECSAKASSAADINLLGEVGELEMDASSAASINALDVSARIKTTAEASSGAKIRTQVGKELSARASSGGSIRYKGGDEVNISIHRSSGGSVRKL